MRRAVAWAALAGAVAAAVYLLIPKEPPPSRPRRPVPPVPSPTLEEKIEYFFALVRSGETLDVQSPMPGMSPLQVSVWREIGEPALLELGQPALDYLTSPERYPEYVSTPDLLVAVLQMLPGAPAFPGLFPFLDHWLDEANCPPRSVGSDWPDEFRNLVFTVLSHHPVPEAVPICVAELTRPRRGHDLRAAAAELLLRLNDADALNEVYATLPPTPDAPEPDLRGSILNRLFQMAAPTAGDRSRGQVAALEPLLQEALESPRIGEQLNAMGVLYRLGRPGMEEAIERFFGEYKDTNEPAAWSALLFLVADGPNEFVRLACLRRVEHPDNLVGFGGAVRILLTHWPDEIAPRVVEWISRREYIDPYLALPLLLRHDRAAVVAWLKDEVKRAGLADLQRALGFISREGITELAPDLLDLVRRMDVSQRPVVYKALVQLRAPAIEALLLAELDASIPAQFKAAAAVELLNLGGEAGLARMKELIAEGDGPALDALLRAARVGGGSAVPPVLVPAVLEALQTIPGEEGRRAALLILRFRGRLDDVREGLIDAYRREPSRRVAKEILETIEELAHR